jgi:hypothetical protein
MADANASSGEQTNSPSSDTQAALAKNNRMMERFLQTLERPLDRMLPNERSSAVRYISVFLLLVIVLGGGFLAWHAFFKPKKVDPVYSKIENLKRVRELHLTKMHFESIIPITKEGRREKFQFLLIAPMELSLYLDLGKLQMSLEPDSLVRITLPAPQVSEIYLDFRKTKEYNYGEQGLFARLLGRDRFDYKAVVTEIKDKIGQGKAKVLERAYSPAVMRETLNKAEDYLRNTLNSLGYRVEFIEPQLQEPEVRLKSELKDFLMENEIKDPKLEKKLFRMLLK